MEIDKVLKETQETLPKRLRTLAKHFPYFEILKINTHSDKFNTYDMGGLSIAIIHFMLYEGHLKDRGLAFEEIQVFVKKFIETSYEKEIENTTLLELTRYILRKMQNKGDFFSMPFYNPVSKKEDIVKIKYIIFEPDPIQNKNLYRLTADGIDFFLQTKEFEEESKITIHLLLLKQLVKNGDYQTALQTLININVEVKKEERQKQEIIEELTMGYTTKYNAFQARMDKRFEEERLLFKDTMQSIETYQEEYLEGIEDVESTKETIAFRRFVHSLKDELTKTTHIHAKMLGISAELAKRKEEIFSLRKRNMFKPSLNFVQLLEKAINNQNTSTLKNALSPLFLPHIHKTFSIDHLQDLLYLKREEKKEDFSDIHNDMLIEKQPTLDEQIKDRLHSNLKFYLRELLVLLLESKEVNLKDYISHLHKTYGEIALINQDIVVFIFSMVREGGTSNLKTFEYKKLKKHPRRHYEIEGVYLELIEEERFKPLRKHIIRVAIISNEVVRINNRDITMFTYFLEGELL